MSVLHDYFIATGGKGMDNYVEWLRSWMMAYNFERGVELSLQMYESMNEGELLRFIKSREVAHADK